jgi:predicted transcriptional regulator
MSIKLMSRVWDIELRHTAKLVLLALADWANDEGACWPSIATLERRCGLSDRGVRNVLEELEAEGRLRRVQRAGRSTMFHLTPEGRALDPGTTFTPTPERGAGHPGTTFTPPRHDVHPTPEPGAGHPGTTFTQNPKEPPIEPPKEPKSARGRPSPIRMPEGLNLEAFALWEDWLHSKLKPMNDISRPLVAANLVAFGSPERQLEVVKHSAGRGWVSLHAPRDDSPPPGGAPRVRVRPKTADELEAEQAQHA